MPSGITKNPKALQSRFKKNDPKTGYRDPKINRKGTIVPKDVKELNALIDQIFSEQTVDDNGEVKTKIKSALEKLLMSRNVAGGIHILDRRFGKVKEQVELTGQVQLSWKDLVSSAGLGEDEEKDE